MSRFTARSWDLPPQVDEEQCRAPNPEGLDPGPLGLVAARIRLFDNRGRDRRSNWLAGPELQAEGAGVGTRAGTSATLGHQSAGKKAKKYFPEYATISRISSATDDQTSDVLRNRVNNRLSGLFNAPQEDKESGKAQELFRRLTTFSLYGLPRLPAADRQHWEAGDARESRISLPGSWRDMVTGHEALSHRHSHQQEAVWELLCTEVAYLKKLHVIVNLFVAGLLNLHAGGLLLEVQPRRLFSNIQEIVRAHGTFWREVLLPFLEVSMVTGQRLDPLRLCDGFNSFPSRFQCYQTYCLSEAACLSYAQNTQENNQLFAMYVKWAETHKQSNRMRLNDMLVKPHQHLTRYPLLLKAILRKTDSSSAKEGITNTIAIIEKFIRGIDSKMKIRAEKYHLAEFAIRVQMYEVVEAISEEVDQHLKDFSHLDLLQPIAGCDPDCVRTLVYEGNLRMKEGKDSKVDVHCFLFTDLLLITKPLKKGKRTKVIRQPLMLEKIVVRVLKDLGCFLLMYVNELCCLVAAYVFQSSSPNACQKWLNYLSIAQKRLEVLRAKESCLGQSQSAEMERECPGKRGRGTPSTTDKVGSFVGVDEGRCLSEEFPLLPTLLVTSPGVPEAGTEPRTLGLGRKSPVSPRMPRPRSPRLVGAQKLIQRHLRKDEVPNGPQTSRDWQDPAGPEENQTQHPRSDWAGQEQDLEIQSQASGREQAAEPEIQPQLSGEEQAVQPEIQPQDLGGEQAAEPEIQPQASGPAEVESGERLEMGAQALERQQAGRCQLHHQEQAGSEGWVEIEAQAGDWDRAQWGWSQGPEETGGEKEEKQAASSVLETLQRAKTMQIKEPGRESETEHTAGAEETPLRPSQHRVLTIGQLQRIRSSLTLNSTQTTSEV